MCAWTGRGPSLLLPVLAFSAAGWVGAQEVHQPESHEEVPLLLRHRPEVSALIVARFHRGEFLLPLVEVLTRLKLVHDFDAAHGRLRVNFGSRSLPTELDFETAEARSGARTDQLRPDDFVRAELEVYVTPRLLQEVFGMGVRVDNAQLAVEITTREEMPVTTEARRRRRAHAPGERAGRWDTQAYFARQRRLFDGAALGYNLSATDGAWRGEARTGVELLGGALELTGSGERRSGRSVLGLRRARWQFVRNSSVLSQVSVGDVQTTGLRSRPLRGMEISNRPVEVRTVLATQLVEGEVPPDWEVELLVNGSVLERARGDALGRFRFAAPLGHGSSRIQLRKLGPDGQVVEDEYVLAVPFTFVPRGVVQYSIAAGSTDVEDARVAHTDVSVGMSDRVTLSTAFDLTPDDRDRRSSVRAAASARLMHGYIGSLEIAPGDHLRADIEAAYPSFARFRASVREGVRRGQSRAFREYSALAFLPAVPGIRRLTARMSATHRRSEGDMAQLGADAELSSSFRRFRPALGYRLEERSTGQSRQTRQELRIASLITPGVALGPLRGMLLRAALRYDVEHSQPLALELSASGAVAAGTALEIAHRRTRDPSRSELQLRLRLDRPWARASTTFARSGAASSVAQTVSGTMGWDSGERRPVMGGRSGQPRAGAALQLFLDENGNGAFDPTEVAVTGVDVQVDRGAQVSGREGGRIHISDLTAHHEYRARLVPRRIANPLWTPAFEGFSFVADPNRYKHIAVPFYAAGVIEGSVLVRRGSKEVPIVGLRLHVRAESGDEVIVPVFGDGTFYHIGLRPGTYQVAVDPAQLEVLGVVALPASRTLEIRHTRDGDLVGDLHFVLIDGRSAARDAP